jgi:hypothetical protein
LKVNEFRHKSLDLKAADVLLILTGMLFSGMYTSRLVQNLDSVLSGNDRPAVVIFKLLFGPMLGVDTFPATCIFAAMLIYLIQKQDAKVTFFVNYKKISNALLYLYICTFFIIPVPGIILTSCLVVLCMLTPHRKSKADTRQLWIVFTLFCILELTVLGSALGGYDEVRNRLPLKVQIIGVIPFLNGFTVYYIIKRNNWSFEEFEIFFKILMLCTTLIALESIVTFYLGIGRNVTLFGNPPFNHDKMFQSVLVARFSTVARLSNVLLFMGIYFFVKNGQKKYVWAALLGFLLLFSTMSRQNILAVLGGLVFWFLFSIFKIKRNVNKSGAQNVVRFFTAIIVMLAGLVILSGFMAFSKHGRHQAGALQFQAAKRLIRCARGVDAFIYTFPLGTGAYAPSYYMGSSLVPWKYTKKVAEHLGYDLDYAKQLIRPPEKKLLKLGYEASYTIHNFWLRSIVEFGVLGLVFALYLLWRGFKIFVRLYQFEKRGLLGKRSAQVWAVYMMVISMCLSVMFTVKFRYYWFFVLLFAFLELWSKSACPPLDRQKCSN